MSLFIPNPLLLFDMNSESSRSHLIFTIKIASVNRETGAKLCGKMSRSWPLVGAVETYPERDKLC